MILLIKGLRNLWKIFITVKNNMDSFVQTKNISELQKIAHELRLDVLEMLRLAGSGHIG